MPWYEIRIKTDSQAVEALTEILNEMGSSGTAVEDPNEVNFQDATEKNWDYCDRSDLAFEFDGALVKGYFETDDPSEIITQLEEVVGTLKEYGLETAPGIVEAKVIYEQDWANEWKKYFKPLRLGKHIVVKPSWESFDLQDDDVLIEIDPGGAFGSGTHETTSMCMELIEKYMDASHADLVYDIGCGSGILAVTAAKFGAKRVIAGDIDPAAIETSLENLRINHVEDNVVVKLGDLLSVAEGKADLVIANIIADVIIGMLDDVKQVMKPSTHFIASGIIDIRLDDVLAAMASAEVEIIEVVRKGSWAAIVAKL